MSSRWYVAAGLICIAVACRAQSTASFDAATAFGARPSASALQMSPDGLSVVYLAPIKGQGSIAYTLSLAKGSVPKAALAADGKPFRLASCHWVSNDRIVCLLYAVEKDAKWGMLKLTRTVAVDADGKNLRVLSTRQNEYSRGWALGGGSVIDWLPDENGAVLMTRVYLPDDHTGSRLGSSSEGLGVDWIDTRTLSVKHVEPARPEVVDYITDGRGTVRIMGTRQVRAGQDTGITTFLYRLAGWRDWHTLGDYNEVDQSGFLPEAVDHERNVAYGYKKKDGRLALYSVTLDEARHEEVVYQRPDVDVRGLVYIGRQHRFVGTSYATDISRVSYFAPDVRSMVASLAKVLPHRMVDVVDTSVDESRLLIFSSRDVDAGVYYIFDRNAHQLQTFLVTRAELEGVTLGHVKPVTYPASDGTAIPAYLTLPSGKEDAKNLPAIVLPHGGPNSRDTWGFRWLPQFFAARGFAVLQPNYRGSSGYGDAWFEKNGGFRSWEIAIGDVSDGGRWLVREGIADPSKLAIVGWSYGGYAALQSAAVNPALFKAVVAIAPVTDLAALKEEHRHWSDFNIFSDYIGEGPHMREGSPIEQATRIKAPVLLFHGGLDSVSIQQSKNMAARLRSAGASCELVTWDELDQNLEDSDARTQMLRTSDEFLRKALGM